MFETHVEGEIPIPAEFGAPSVRAWSYVLCRLFKPWLHVVRQVPYPADEGGEAFELQETLFLSHVEQLPPVMRVPGARIVSIDLMSPGQLNGSGYWKLEPLAEIWEGVVPSKRGDQRARVYVLEDGRRYFDAAPEAAESDLVDKRQLIRVRIAAPTRNG